MQSKQNLRSIHTVSLFTILLSILVLLAFDCTTESPTASGGSGTGVGNGVVIVGKVIGSDSLPVRNAIVRIRTDCYLADTSGIVCRSSNDTLSNVSTDNSGVFAFDSIRHGKLYCIEILDTTNHTQLAGTIYKVNVPAESRSDTVKLPTRVVVPVKTLEGSIVLNGLPQNAYVQIYGMERIDRTDSTGKFEIKQLPIGECERDECEYKLRIMVVQDDGLLRIYNSELEVKFDRNQKVVSVELELENDRHSRR